MTLQAERPYYPPQPPEGRPADSLYVEVHEGQDSYGLYGGHQELLENIGPSTEAMSVTKPQAAETETDMAPARPVEPDVVSLQGVKRAVESLQFLRAVQPKSEAPTEEFEAIKPLSPAAERFWNGEGYVERPPTLAAQLAEIKANPNARGNILMSKPKAIVGSHEGLTLRTKHTYTEREALDNYDNYLTEATAALESDPSDSGKPYLQDLHRLREKTTFLGQEEYDKAIKGIPAMWAEYLKQSPDHTLNIFNVEQSGSIKTKSYSVVTEAAISAFLANEDNAEIADRLHVKPDEWVDGPHARLVIMDDWVIRGTTIKMQSREATKAANGVGLPGLADKIEAHVLLSRAEHDTEIVQNTEYGQIKAVRAYYETEGAEFDYNEPITGAHSSVDFNFDLEFNAIDRYLQKNGHALERPLLTDLQRPYQMRQEFDDPRVAEGLAEYAETNRELAELEAQLQPLREKSLTIHADQETWDGIDELEDKKVALNRRRAHLLMKVIPPTVQVS